MDERITQLEHKVAALEDRNQRVESDKAWETSGTRVVVLAAITYVVACIVLRLLNSEYILLGALIPAAGFVLSVQTLPLLKRQWVKRYWNKNNSKK
jgi:hypothetical protein